MNHTTRFGRTALAMVVGCSWISFGSVAEAAPEALKEVRFLSPDWLCAVVDPTAEILATRDSLFKAELEKDRADHARLQAEGKKGWYLEKSKHYRTLLVQNTLHRELFASMNRASFWTVNGKRPADVTVWAHSVDGVPADSATDAPALDSMPLSRVADMVYLRLPTTVVARGKVEVRGGDGRAGVLQFDEDSTVCWSIKVNQVGYRPGVLTNRAYLGMWLPGIGALDFSKFEGKPFVVRRFERGAGFRDGRAVGDAVMKGKIALRRKFADQHAEREGGSNLTGEDVYEMDLSGVQGSGEFCVQIPGLGRSWPFTVGENALGESYFMLMKGLFTQRCGMELRLPFTAWERGACHETTLPGRFLPETEGWYRGAYRKGDSRFGIRDEQGKQISPSTFTLVGNSDPNGNPLPGVKGGWHDAADFDRRIYHYNVVSDLLAAYESNAKALGDKQLNIPESGNGVPDILDEALWGIDVWRLTQTAEGAVSSWIEQRTHPGTARTLEESIAKDPLPMFSAVPDRCGSFAYAAAAAWAGRLLRPFDQKRADAFIESSVRAYAWASKPDSVIKGWTLKVHDGGRDTKLKGTTIAFDEDPEVRTEDNLAVERAFAALNLLHATARDTYRKDWEAFGMGKQFHLVAHRVNPCRLVPLFKQGGVDASEVGKVLEALRRSAEGLMASQSEHAYRMLWLGPKDGWFHTLAWGNYHSKLRLVGTLYAATGEALYRDALASGSDFFLGCNPMGTTLVSGLGSVFPVVFQHIHSQSDGIAEPTPGIAPYWYTYGVSMNGFLLADAGHGSVKGFYQPFGLALIPDKLGREKLQADIDRADKVGDWPREVGKPVRDVIWKNWPIFRRHTTHPAAVVEQNEFTVGETISPLAFAFSLLIGEGWTPSRELLERRPKTNVSDLPYYPQP